MLSMSHHDTIAELHAIHRELHRARSLLYDALVASIFHSADLEGKLVMSALSDLQALGPRLDAILAAMSTDIGDAVAKQKATDDAANQANIDALAQAKTDAASAESALAAEVTDLTAKVVALEAKAGVTPPAPSETVTLSPTDVTTSVGVSASLSGAGGTAPYTFATSDPFTNTGGSLTSDGVFTGTTAGTDTVNVTATDSLGVASAPTAVTFTTN